MRECTFIFKPLTLAVTIFSLIGSPALSWAEDDPNGEQKEEESKPEDFSSTPFSQYADFEDPKEDAERAKFFRNGRFFAVSAGIGVHGVTGNRGALWQGGVPAVDLKLHYWFDLNFSLQLNMFLVPHSYEGSDPVTVNIVNAGVDLKYYFDTTNWSAALAFAHPHLLVGGGSYTKTESSAQSDTPSSDTTLGIGAGAGIEFPISHKKVYFMLQSKLYYAGYQDRLSTDFSSTHGINDLTGIFYQITAGLMLSW